MADETSREMEASAPKAESEASMATGAKPPRIRRSRKRTRFAVPQHPAKSVKALWLQASEKERDRAHRIGMLILETWLGKKSRLEAAKELDLPVLRFWQLSQQAVSGMLAGLLTQPRTRRTSSMPELAPEEDPRLLLKRITKLEKDLKTANDLIEVLKLIPDRPQAPPEKEPGPPRKKKGVRARSVSKAKPAGGKRRRSSPESNAGAGGDASFSPEA